MTKDATQVTQADRDAVTAFHAAQIKRILAGDKTLGQNRDAIEHAFARHREATTSTITAQVEALVSLLTKAVGDIAAALELAGSAHLISKWTADYVVAINAHDTRAALASTSEGGSMIKNDSCHPEDSGQDYIDCPHCACGRIYSLECDCCGWVHGTPPPERRSRFTPIKKGKPHA